MYSPPFRHKNHKHTCIYFLKFLWNTFWTLGIEKFYLQVSKIIEKIHTQIGSMKTFSCVKKSSFLVWNLWICNTTSQKGLVDVIKATDLKIGILLWIIKLNPITLLSEQFQKRNFQPMPNPKLTGCSSPFWQLDCQLMKISETEEETLQLSYL